MHQELPAPTRRLRLGIVGGGEGALIGKIHALGAKLSDRWDVVAGALSSRPDVARRSGKEWMLAPDRAYLSFVEMAAAESAREDGIDAVAIATPNHLHHAIAVAFMERGIDVICDKPLTTTVADAVDLVERQRSTGLVFGVTYAYSAHAMVRQAREMVQAGDIGRIRQIHIEYVQEWAMPPPARKEAAWRLDPQRSGRSFSVADVGTHAHHLAGFVAGKEITSLRAEFHVCGADKPMEDTAFLHVRYEGDIPGTMWITQAAPGNYCGLRLRIFGERAGLEWDQENPEQLWYSRLNAPRTLILRGKGSGVGDVAGRLIRAPRGHAEGFLDAWANLYTEFAVAIDARRTGESVPDGLISYPTVVDGARGVVFVEAAVESSLAGGAWKECTLTL